MPQECEWYAIHSDCESEAEEDEDDETIARFSASVLLALLACDSDGDLDEEKTITLSASDDGDLDEEKTITLDASEQRRP